MIRGLLKDYADNIQAKAMLEIYRKAAKYSTTIAKAERQRLLTR